MITDERLAEIASDKDNFYRDEIKAMAVEIQSLRPYKDELEKIAADLGEPDDPFAAWEALAAPRASSGVEVKGLEWEYIEGRSLSFWRAKNPFGGLPFEAHSEKQKVRHEADYRQRVLSCLSSPLPTVEVTEKEAPMIMRMVAVGNALSGWMDMSNPGAQTEWAKWRDTSAEALKLATVALSQNKGE